jgi:integrase
MARLRKKPLKDGKWLYYWRGIVPVKEANGETSHRRVERSTGTCNHAKAQEIGRRFEAELYAAADADTPLQEQAEVTFAGASILYMKSGGSGRFLDPILAQIGTLPLSAITQARVQELIDEIYPTAAASTINRQAFTPILAVLNYAARKKMCPPPLLDRPIGHDAQKPLKVPDEAWFDAVLPELSPKHRALILLLTYHGLRIADAIERTPDDVETDGWRLHIPKTKNGDAATIRLSKPVVEALKAYDWRAQKWLFGTCHRSNIARAIKAACKRAGVRSFGSHAIGRHAFSTRVLKQGKSLKFLKEAGRWKSPSVPMKRYGHLEQSEVADEVNQIAAECGEKSKNRQVAIVRKA